MNKIYATPLIRKNKIDFIEYQKYPRNSKFIVFCFLLNEDNQPDSLYS